jgi:hypothetical protein
LEDSKAASSRLGVAYFEMPEATRGVYRVHFDGVVLDEHRFDGDNSILDTSIQAKW